MCTGMVGGLVGAAGAIAGGMAKKADARLQAEVARNNAGVAETTAETNEVLAQLPQIAAKLDAQKIKDALRVALGAETATYSTANLDPSSGAPLLIAGVSVAQAHVDLGLTKVQADLGTAARMADAASGYAGAATERFRVVAAENEARNAMTSAFFGAATALLGGMPASGFGGGGSPAAPSYTPPMISGGSSGSGSGYGGYIPGGYAGSRIASSAYSPSGPYYPGNRDYRGQ